MADGLQLDLYKIMQGKNEKVRQFVGRLEAQFGRLKEKVPGRYEEQHPEGEILSWNASTLEGFNPVLLQTGRDHI